MKVKSTVLTLAAMVLAPAMAFAHLPQSLSAQGPTPRMRPTLFHDRSPRPHEHISVPHH